MNPLVAGRSCFPPEEPGSLELDRRRSRSLPLTDLSYERMFASMVTGNLTEERLESIERGARERHTLMDRVVLELVEEVRRLRGVIARMEEQ
jgi:hypothetical protein